MSADTPRGVRPHGRTSAATLAAVSVLATGGVLVATPGVATAAPLVTTVQRGLGVASSVTGPFVVQSGPARITQSALGADKTTILKGQSIVFTGRLTTGAAQAPVANHPVRLESSTGGEWKTVGTALAGPDGSVTFTVKATTSAKYRLAYSGVMALSSSASPEQAVAVRVPVVVRPVISSSSSGSARASSGGGSSTIGSHGVAPSGTALAFVEAAKAHYGKRYVYATAGPNTFDCSGLVKYVAAQFGLSLPHNANSQKAYGTPVSAADAAPGDLIFFLDGGYAYHVGIYAGGNMMIDAPNSRSTVGLHTIWGSNVTFRRIF